jgi:iron-sulfur cluster repair protein YtfE (RIC family)
MTKSCGCGCQEHGAAQGNAARYTAETPVGAVGHDAAGRAVLERFGLNHCCGAHLSLREGAAAAGVPLADVLTALNAETGARV